MSDSPLRSLCSLYSLIPQIPRIFHIPAAELRVTARSCALLHSRTLQLTNKIKEGICKKHLFIILFYTYFDTNN